MTMQVGMVGSDGIVLAGDTRWTVMGQADRIETRFSPVGSKIWINDSKTIAVMCAKDMAPAYRIAQAICESDLEKETDTDVICRRIQEIGVLQTGPGKHNPQCTIAIAVPSPSLFYFEYLDENTPLGNHCPSYYFAGDTMNAATWWMHYHDWKPTTQLLRLAAQMISTASELTPDYIHGLEMAYCSGGKFYRLSDANNAEYKAAAKRVDKRISDLILSDNPI